MNTRNESMNTFSLPARGAVYVTDSYCGWCWGFAARLAEFELANRHRVPFTAVSGGLFIGPRVGPLGAYPHIPGANARIAALTGAHFGAAYQSALAEGSLVMDSTDAAAALAALRNAAPQRAIEWAERLQEAFYGRGLSLSLSSTVEEVATAGGLDAAKVIEQIASGAARTQALRDFELARSLGVASYPTLLFLGDRKVHALPASGTSLEVLNERLDALLA